jgi:hypothetical protein
MRFMVLLSTNYIDTTRQRRSISERDRIEGNRTTAVHHRQEYPRRDNADAPARLPASVR